MVSFYGGGMCLANIPDDVCDCIQPSDETCVSLIGFEIDETQEDLIPSNVSSCRRQDTESCTEFAIFYL
jgi:hypothetical protein